MVSAGPTPWARSPPVRGLPAHLAIATSSRHEGGMKKAERSQPLVLFVATSSGVLLTTL
jgi:hypothetical protein